MLNTHRRLYMAFKLVGLSRCSFDNNEVYIQNYKAGRHTMATCIGVYDTLISRTTFTRLLVNAKRIAVKFSVEKYMEC